MIIIYGLGLVIIHTEGVYSITTAMDGVFLIKIKAGVVGEGRITNIVIEESHLHIYALSLMNINRKAI